jgi:dynein heavy chain
VLVFLTDFDSKTLTFLLGKIFEWGFRDHPDKVAHEARNYLAGLALAVHREVAAEFLPLPDRSHYLFNLRDLMRVV